jgi:ribosomal protein L11
MIRETRAARRGPAPPVGPSLGALDISLRKISNARFRETLPWRRKDEEK